MSKAWTELKLGNVISQRKEFITIKDTQEYMRCKVQLHTKGIILRDRIMGSEIKTKKQQVCKAGEFLVAEIDAKVGGFGIIPDILEGSIVSNHYFLFVIDTTKLDCRFLDYYTRTPAFKEQINAQGSTNYAAIKSNDVLNYTIPLPPLAEQQRIVARIESLAARITEAQKLREEAIAEIEALKNSIINNLMEQNQSNWTHGSIPEFANINPSRKGQITVKGEELVSFVPMRTVDDITGTIMTAETRPYNEVNKGYTWFQNGDIIFARITPCMENGKSAIAKNLVNGIAFGSTEFHVLRPGNKILAEWLHVLVRSKQFRNDAVAHFKGTAGQQRVPQSFLDNKIIPVPPLAEQHRIVTYLDNLHTKIQTIHTIQTQTNTELNAMLPAILDRAFKGEL